MKPLSFLLVQITCYYPIKTMFTIKLLLNYNNCYRKLVVNRIEVEKGARRAGKEVERKERKKELAVFNALILDNNL